MELALITCAAGYVGSVASDEVVEVDPGLHVFEVRVHENSSIKEHRRNAKVWVKSELKTVTTPPDIQLQNIQLQKVFTKYAGRIVMIYSVLPDPALHWFRAIFLPTFGDILEI